LLSPCEPNKKDPCAWHLRRPTPLSVTLLLAQTVQPIPTDILNFCMLLGSHRTQNTGPSIDRSQVFPEGCLRGSQTSTSCNLAECSVSVACALCLEFKECCNMLEEHDNTAGGKCDVRLCRCKVIQKFKCANCGKIIRPATMALF